MYIFQSDLILSLEEMTQGQKPISKHTIISQEKVPNYSRLKSIWLILNSFPCNDRGEFLKTCCWRIYFQRSFSSLAVLINQHSKSTLLRSIFKLFKLGRLDGLNKMVERDDFSGYEPPFYEFYQSWASFHPPSICLVRFERPEWEALSFNGFTATNIHVLPSNWFTI